MGFQKTGARQKPTLVCVGTLKSFGGLNKSKTEGSPYYYENLEIAPQGDGKPAKLRFMWAPAWFQAAYGGEAAGAALDAWCEANPKGEKPASKFVFEKNVGGRGKKDQSFLEGLAASEEPWEALSHLVTASATELTAEEVHELLASFFQDLGPQVFLYVLEQEKKDGQLTEYYEVQQIRWLNEDNLKYLVKKAEYQATQSAKGGEAAKKAGAPWVFTFDPQDLGLDVSLPVESDPSWVTA